MGKLKINFNKKGKDMGEVFGLTYIEEIKITTVVRLAVESVIETKNNDTIKIDSIEYIEKLIMLLDSGYIDFKEYTFFLITMDEVFKSACIIKSLRIQEEQRKAKNN